MANAAEELVRRNRVMVRLRDREWDLVRRAAEAVRERPAIYVRDVVLAAARETVDED